MRKTYRLPLSGQIVGEVFRILRFPYPDHLAKEMQLYFRGERIQDKIREEILHVLVDALLKDGIILYPPIFDQAFVCEWGLRNHLVKGISDYADRWDSTCANLRHWTIQDKRKEDLLYSCLRLVTIDIALRLASYRHLAKAQPLGQTMPLWIKRRGNAEYLRNLKKQCKTPVSCATLTTEVEVTNEKTKAAWFYRGQRPTREHVEKLAKALARRMPCTNEHLLLADMNRQYALSELFDKLSSRIGRDRVMELVGALYHQTSRLVHFFETDSKPVEEHCSRYLLNLRDGTGRSFQSPPIQYLWDTEKDTEWKQDIVCVERDWAHRVVQSHFPWTSKSILLRQDCGTFYSYAPDRISASFDYTSARFTDHMIDGEMALWAGAGPEAYDWDEKAEDQFRSEIQSNPDDARAHLNLGVYLGMNSSSRGQIEEGFQECRKAACLQPNWDLPRIEAANVLLRVGNHCEALALLEQDAAELARMSPRLAYTIGFARMLNNDIGGALCMFEKATALNPDYALAFDNAAYCSFLLGDSKKGKRYARSAHQLGISATYDKYDVGKTRRESEGIPFRSLCERVPCRIKSKCPHRSE